MIKKKDVFTSIEKSIESLDCKRISNGIYQFKTDTDLIGTLGLNTAIYKSDKIITVNPVIGFIQQKIQMLAVDLTDNVFKKNHPPLLFCNIGYIMPQKKYVEWSFNGCSRDRTNSENILNAIKQYGIPWIKYNSKLENCLKELYENKKGMPGQREYTIPILMHYLGKTDDAVRFIEDFKSAMIKNNTHTEILDRYAKFSLRFMNMVNQSK